MWRDYLGCSGIGHDYLGTGGQDSVTGQASHAIAWHRGTVPGRLRLGTGRFLLQLPGIAGLHSAAATTGRGRYDDFPGHAYRAGPRGAMISVVSVFHRASSLWSYGPCSLCIAHYYRAGSLYRYRVPILYCIPLGHPMSYRVPLLAIIFSLGYSATGLPGATGIHKNIFTWLHTIGAPMRYKNLR